MNHYFAAAESPIHVSLPAEAVFHLGPIPVTNSMILGAIGYALTIWLLFWLAGKTKRGEHNRFVTLVMWLFETLLTTTEQVLGDRKLAHKVAPFAITMFFFILINYWLGILPGVGSITVGGVPLFRGLVADLNVTFALAITSLVLAQAYAIKNLGFFGNLGRYFRNPFKDPAGAFEGFLEIFADFSRFTALSLRLFGNVFAGEVLLLVVAFLSSYATPIALPPFMFFELFIGAVQAYVFFMLTIVFISLGASHGAHSDDHSSAEAKSLDTAAPQRA